VSAVASDVESSPWAAHRRRAQELRQRHPFADEVLGFYTVILGVRAQAWEDTRAQQPEHLAAWAAQAVLPRVVAATEAAGPEVLAKAVTELSDGGGLQPCLDAWLAGGDLDPVERFLARATLTGPLVALGDEAGAACAADPAPRGDRRCPRCGALPQLSLRTDPADPLVSGARLLACSRCDYTWGYSGTACPSCGETSGGTRTVYAEARPRPAVGTLVGRGGGDGSGAGGASGARSTEVADSPIFPHLHVDTCSSCGRYVIDVDLGADPRAVPEVDELAALPLDLYAAERNLTKITPNLMGF